MTLKNPIVQLIFFLAVHSAVSQGLSTSVLIPDGGKIGIPVSPVSVRGVGLGENAGIEGGFTFYSIPGLHISGLSFEAKKPLVDQTYAVLVPVELFARLTAGPMGVKFLGGGFFNWIVSSKLNHGNLDRALLAAENWEVATSSARYKMKSGVGLMGGIEFEFRVTKQFSLTFETQYVYGQNPVSLKGFYSGGDPVTYETKELDESDLSAKFQGLEFSLGVRMAGK